jgi:hypothetical protein
LNRRLSSVATFFTQLDATPLDKASRVAQGARTQSEAIMTRIHSQSAARDTSLVDGDVLTFREATNVRPQTRTASASSGPAHRSDDFPTHGTASCGGGRLRFSLRHGAHPTSTQSAASAQPAMSEATQRVAVAREALHAAEAIPMKALAQSQIPARPRSLHATLEEQRERAFHDGGLATAESVIGSALSAFHGPGAIVAEVALPMANAVREGRELHHHGESLSSAAREVAPGLAATLAGVVLDHLKEDTFPFAVAYEGAKLTLSSVAHTLTDGDEAREVAERETAWEATRDEILARGRRSATDGSFHARHADLSRTVPGGRVAGIDWNRMANDGDYNLAVRTALSERVQTEAR